MIEIAYRVFEFLLVVLLTLSVGFGSIFVIVGGILLIKNFLKQLKGDDDERVG